MLRLIRQFNKRLFYQLFYLRRPPWDTNISPPELVEHIQSHPPGRALDLGCGTGTNVITLARRGWQATGVDFVPKAIRTARRKAGQAGLQASFHLGSVSDPKFFHGEYDLILDIGCYHSLGSAERQNYRQLVARHLAPAGTYMLYGFLGEDPARISQADITAFQQSLILVKRTDSADPSGPASTWLWFQPQGRPD